jgi:uncharacterized Zn finger protein
MFTQRDEPPEPTGWARQWLDTIKGFRPENEELLARGAIDARQGTVLEETVLPGEVRAAVVRTSTYHPAIVTIQIATYSDAAWQRVATVLAARADLAARLLAGEVPLELDGTLAPLGLSLLPRGPGEITATCTCRQGQLCPHVAAVHYILATNLERQPNLLFALRGRDLSALLDDMREHWSRGQPQSGRAAEVRADAGDTPPLEPLRAEQFYRAGPALDALRITITPPRVEAALLKRLGRPPFAALDEDPVPALARVYATVTRRALGAPGRAERRRPGQG